MKDAEGKYHMWAADCVAMYGIFYGGWNFGGESLPGESAAAHTPRW